VGVEQVHRPGNRGRASRHRPGSRSSSIGTRRSAFEAPAGIRLCAVGVCLAALVGCTSPKTPYPESFNSFRAEERILAARHAAEIQDRQSIPLLVDRLEDEDSAVRMFSILALEKLTGTRLGYEYRDGASERGRAVERWRRFVAEASESQPAAGEPVAAGGGS